MEETTHHPKPDLFEKEGVRVAVEGCGHGTLNAIYAATTAAASARGWPGVDVLIICGDFQSTRNGRDVEVMSVPAKYRALGDFHEYYAGHRTAPYLTLFIAGNHEAAAYLWELYYGGWVAPNIYYMGAANVLRVGPLRIAGLSGIWKGFDYRKSHRERLPFSHDDVKSFYHVREFDVRKLLQIREQVDVGLSHDWPRGIEKHGDVQQLYRLRPMWKQESLDGSLGSPAAEYVMDRLRPPYWFSAHMHWKFAAVKTYPPPGAETSSGEEAVVETTQAAKAPAPAPAVPEVEATVGNPNEIDLDMNDDDDEVAATPATPAAANGNKESDPKEESTETTAAAASNTVAEDLRALLPASFTQARPSKPRSAGPKRTPGQPVPPTITNTEVRFLALNKCEPGRDFLQLCDIHPIARPSPNTPAAPAPGSRPEEGSTTTDTPDGPNRYPLRYDPEWLSITRAFHPLLTIGDRTAQVAPDEGDESYAPAIARERAWVEERIGLAASDLLRVPENFSPTAPAVTRGETGAVRDPALLELHSGVQPVEHTNPQTVAFCEMLGLSNLWDASEEEREERRRRGPPAVEFGGERGERGGFRGGGGFGGGRGRGGGGSSGRGGRGGRGGGRGRGRGR
ncbi:lariat debranching enzyme [Cytospora paraplurivora]|uniref:Lariat debranching enzyme n=1 Tax=Cytospora paraplurivora TaxID=2898453 RepID=A0AAN9UPH1_9PEZI